jgi:hypothetical protein
VTTEPDEPTAEAAAPADAEPAATPATPTADTATDDTATGDAPRKHRGRATVSILLAVIGGVLLPLAGFTIWTRNQLLDTDRYVASVAPLATDPAIQDAAAARLTKTVSEAVDFKKVAAESLPQKAQVLAGPIASGAEGLVSTLSDKAVKSKQFQTLWDDANRAGHKALVAAVTGEGSTSVETNNGKVVVEFGPLAKQVLKAVDKETGLDLADKVPADKIKASYVLVDSRDLARVQSAVKWLNRLTWIISIAALACLIGAVFAATDRRVGVRRAGWAVTIASALTLVAFAIGRNRYLSSLPTSVSQAAATSTFDILVENLRIAFRVTGIIGVLLLLGSLVHLPSRDREPGPVATWVTEHVVVVRTLIVVLGALVLLALDQPAVASVVGILAVIILLLVVVQVMVRPSRSTPPATTA